MGSAVRGEEPCRHEALLYRDRDHFLRTTLPLAREVVGVGGTVVVALDELKSAALRDALAAPGRLHVAEHAQFVSNPGRLIASWERLLAAHTRPGRPVLAIGEPIWPGRPPHEVVECHRHEALVNLAFATPGVWLLCLYQVGGLGSRDVEVARRTHPFVRESGRSSPSRSFAGSVPPSFEDPLLPPPTGSTVLRFDRSNLGAARRRVARAAARAGMAAQRAEELVLAVNELASNAVRHGDGGGALEIWSEPSAVVCEVRGRGHIADPLAGRRPPSEAEAVEGRGLWITNQLCDLVQIRSFPTGCVVRVWKGLG